jgi:methyl-accepting chemotaxis protein
MKDGKLNGSDEIQSKETESRGNIRELTRSSGALRQVENSDGELAANSLNSLLSRVSEASRPEIENLVGDLQTLDKKLQADVNRIQRDIEEYAELSQHVMQLTTIIAESVKKLPDAPAIIPQVVN